MVDALMKRVIDASDGYRVIAWFLWLLAFEVDNE